MFSVDLDIIRIALGYLCRNGWSEGDKSEPRQKAVRVMGVANIEIGFRKEYDVRSSRDDTVAISAFV